MNQDYASTLSNIQAEKNVKKAQLKSAKTSLSEYTDNLEKHKRIRTVFQEAAVLVQNNLSDHISNIVTRAINTIWPEKEIKFHAKFIERRNKTECDLFLVENGYEYTVLDSRGHGMADIISMALRVAYINLDTCDNMLILDEPFRNLSTENHAVASHMLKELSKELEMQFIISTHIEHLVEYADKEIKVKLKNGVSYAE